jgi:alkylhydroperoxidase family enzyme
MSSHTALAKQQGVSEELLDAMYHIDEHAGMFTPAERAALTLAERMTTDARGVDEEVWADLREHFDEGEIIELAAVIGLFNYFNRFNDALKVPITPPAEPATDASETETDS